MKPLGIGVLVCAAFALLVHRLLAQLNDAWNIW